MAVFHGLLTTLSLDLRSHFGAWWVCANEQGWEAGVGAPSSGMLSIDKEEIVSDNDATAQSPWRGDEEWGFPKMGSLSKVSESHTKVAR